MLGPVDMANAYRIRP